MEHLRRWVCQAFNWSPGLAQAFNWSPVLAQDEGSIRAALDAHRLYINNADAHYYIYVRCGTEIT